MRFGQGYSPVFVADQSQAADMGVVLSSWTWQATAWSGSVTHINTTAVLTGPQYPAAGYGAIVWRFTCAAPAKTITLGPSNPAVHSNHYLEDTSLDGSYQGLTYTVKYKIGVDGVWPDWTDLVGTTIQIPTWPAGPYSGP